MGCFIYKVTDLIRSVLGKSKNTDTAAIVLAAGRSTRMGSDTPKQLIEINGVPVLIHSLRAFENSRYIRKIVLVVPSGEESVYRALCKAHGIKKLSDVVAGGETRNASAANGFKKIGADIPYVAIHDAARCLVTAELIDRVCTAAVRYNAATAATRSVDTVKISGKNKFIDHTEARNHVWLAQTPQVFLSDLYRAASYIADQSSFIPTDDNMLIENVKHKVRLVECGKFNIKITTPNDLILAKAILDARTAGEEEDLPEDSQED